ncbi:DEAD/DEAH box helicase domain protein [Candidatus Phaeomarinobacter ectocarpi]|uniref:DEAD/DEAH box helicase domain protein n=1 Tax=Candidatus Phaeomarinibacter ectocarpi TaxID=1458461 RepID=X5MND7_9HYPH|nr:DEAD/DEAH box helicase [Candidatus Phaeomarinobacter ectocarpi]CDO60026.1 DEAD/DEAH box helicase domain protein [Candidatus Phaeomarinobacter ectocarpi]
MKDTELFDWLTQEAFRADIDRLTQHTVATEITNLEESYVCDSPQDAFDWAELLLAGSLLARSDMREHQEAALRIATAAVTLDTTPDVRDAGAILFEKLSNHRSVELAQERGRIEPDLDGRLGVSMRLEASRRYFDDSIFLESSGKRISVNDFQRDLWNGASSGASWLSASAPTASGKTFLVLQWLLDHLRTNETRVAVYLAPTRALVSEIELNLKELCRSGTGIEISSLPLPDAYFSAVAGDKKAVFVFTQERLHLLANLLGDQLKVDLLVVDEAHKIGDHQRGVILQDAVERVSRENSAMQVVFVSPSTQNPEELLEDAPEGVQKSSVDSDMPTVLQNVILAEQAPRKPKDWNLDLVRGDSVIRLGTLKLASKPAGLKKRLAFIAAAAGESGGTLIYCNGAAEAEDVALLISQLEGSAKTQDQELLDLADLARKGVHRNYQLAPLVEHGVAFHYGNMPSLIRTEIERLFRIGKIRFLACTSTLIEGVNLSCRTIVVRGPRKGRGNPMEPHDFWNLAGRAGRWGNEFQGNVICIDPHDERAWPIGVPKRSRYPIKRETDAVLALSDDLAVYLESRNAETLKELQQGEEFEQVGAYLLNTYIRLGSLSQAPFAKRHPEGSLEKLDKSLESIARSITITKDVLVKHPGVSAVGLQRLLDIFRAYEGNVENLLLAPSESVDAYDRYVTVMQKINDNLYPVFLPDGLIPLHALIVVEWLKGFSLSTIIRKRIEYQERQGRPFRLPVLIRETMNIVEETARFKAPKYISAYVDVLRLFLVESGRDDLIDEDFDIGVALEFGVSSTTLLSLMELGLSRMSAVALYEKIARDDLDRDGCLSWINEHSPNFAGMDLPNLIVRETLAITELSGSDDSLQVSE